MYDEQDDEMSLSDALRNFYQGMTSPKNWKELGEGVSRLRENIPRVSESVTRGALAQIPGTVGDIESLGRTGLNYLNRNNFQQNKNLVDEETTFPTTREILNYVPRISDTHEGAETLEDVGSIIAPGIGKLATEIKATPEIAKSLKGVPVGASIKPVDEIPVGAPKPAKPEKVYAPADELGFYSNVEKASLNLQRKSGSGDAFLNDIMKQPGVNKEELEWMGLPEFLKGRKGITREEVQDFVNSHRIQFEEKVLGGLRNPTKEAVEAQKEFDDLVNTGKTDEATINRMNELAEMLAKPKAEFIEPEYANIARTPNGDNYREILIKLPESSLQKTYDDISMELYGKPWSELGMGEAGYAKKDYVAKVASESTYTGQHFGEDKNILVHLRVDDRVDAENKVGMLLDEIQSDWHQAGRKAGYQKGSTSEIERQQAKVIDLKAQLDELDKSKPNSDFWVLKSSDGKNLPEKYSSFGEAEKAFDELGDSSYRIGKLVDISPEYKAWNEKAAPIRNQYLDENSKLRGMREDAQMMEDLEDGALFPVPNAPFKENYHEIALKRALVEGAKGNYDRIYLPTGDDLVARYKQALTKEVDEVRLKKLPNGKYNFVAGKDGRPVAGERDIPASRVREMLGKAAEDLIKMADNRYVTAPASPEATMKAKDLRVGGEGMRKYYDEIYPSFLKKFAKKYGGNVGKTKIPTAKTMYVITDSNGLLMSSEDFTTKSLATNRLKRLINDGILPEDSIVTPIKQGEDANVFYYEFSPEARQKIIGGVPMKKGGKVRFSNNPDVQTYEAHFSAGGTAVKSAIAKMREMLDKGAIKRELSGEAKQMDVYKQTGKMPETKPVTSEEIEQEYLRRQKPDEPEQLSLPLRKGGKVRFTNNMDVMRLTTKR